VGAVCGEYATPKTDPPTLTSIYTERAIAKIKMEVGGHRVLDWDCNPRAILEQRKSGDVTPPREDRGGSVYAVSFALVSVMVMVMVTDATQGRNVHKHTSRTSIQRQDLHAPNENIHQKLSSCAFSEILPVF